MGAEADLVCGAPYRVDKSMDALVWLRKQLDLLREMVRSFAEGLMGAEADRGAPYRVVSDQSA